MRFSRSLRLCVALVLCVGASAAAEPLVEKSRLAAAEAAISAWPDAGRVTARGVMARYGAPGEVTPTRLVWAVGSAEEQRALTLDAARIQARALGKSPPDAYD